MVSQRVRHDLVTQQQQSPPRTCLSSGGFPFSSHHHTVDHIVSIFVTLSICSLPLEPRGGVCFGLLLGPQPIWVCSIIDVQHVIL